MRILIIAALSFYSLVAGAQRYLLKNERRIFSFETHNGKRAMLAMDKDSAYIVYRFGTKDSVEFEYPAEKNMDSWKKFEYAFYLRGGGIQNAGMDLNYVYFTNNGYKYVLYSVYYSEPNRPPSGIGIGVTNLSTKKTTTIRGVEKTQKGTLIDLRDFSHIEIDNFAIPNEDIKS